MTIIYRLTRFSMLNVQMAPKVHNVNGCHFSSLQKGTKRGQSFNTGLPKYQIGYAPRNQHMRFVSGFLDNQMYGVGFSGMTIFQNGNISML